MNSNNHNARRITKVLLVGSTLMAASVVHANYWCDCALKTPAQWFSAADAVFVGEVTQPGEDNGRAGATAQFKVTQPLKGKLQDNVTVDYDFGGSQAVQFQQGKSYLIYAVGQDRLMTDSCCGTKPFNAAVDDLKAIRRQSQNQKSEARPTTNSNKK
jgi:hypothetical protein